jgi:hypothetical protein
MSTPILYGSPRAQKNYIRPKFEGLAPRTTPFGYNKDQSVDRYVIPPTALPLIATGYNYGFLVGSRQQSAPYANTAIEQYNFSNDTVAAQTITLSVPQYIQPPLIPTVEPFLSQYLLTNNQSGVEGAVQHGSNSYGYKSTRASSFNANKQAYGVGQVFFWNYANTAEQTNNVDLAPLDFANQSAINDKTNGRGLVHLGTRSTGPGLGTDTILYFPFNTANYAGNLEDISDGVATFPLSAPNPSDIGTKRWASSSQDLNNGFSVGGRNNPSLLSTDVGLKVPFSNLNTSKFIGGLNTSTYSSAGNSSSTHGYTSTGYSPSPSVIITTISKFPFAADLSFNQTVAGDLDVGVIYSGSFSSDTYAYVANGRPAPGPLINVTEVVQKFPFANDTPVTNPTTLSYSSNNGDGSTEG